MRPFSDRWKRYADFFIIHAMARKVIFALVLSVSFNAPGIPCAGDLLQRNDGIPPARDVPGLTQSSGAAHEFDNGSKIQIAQLTPLQVENLATLARVWGFLKYHDPVITAGERSWDFDLFRIMPGVLAVQSRAASNALLVNWIDSLGPIDACDPCASLDTARGGLKPDIAWIGDTEYLSVPLARRLEAIYRNRVRHQQYYVALTNIGNPSFDHESHLTSFPFPDSGFQLLGLFRLWNIVEYWAPYRNVVGEDWLDVLTNFIRRIALAGDRDSYAREMMALTAEIHDGHANLWSSLDVRPPVGRCRLPLNVRFIDRSAIVTGYTSEAAGRVSGLKLGDEIITLDGVPISKLVADWTPLYAASNDAGRLRDIARTLTNGPCGPSRIEVRRDHVPLSLPATRLDPSKAGTSSLTHDLPGPTFRMISSEIAYLKLSSIKNTELIRYIGTAKGTRGLIVDIRNYPSNFVVFTLGPLLIERPTPFAEATAPDLSNPGAFYFQPLLFLTPAEPHYDGKVIILVDEATQSQAEFTAMALRSAPKASVLGSTTAGADGNVSRIALPGGLSTMISGLGVYYPDGTPTQQVGIHVDLEVRPTLSGIRAGRDEVLESAIHQINPSLSSSEVEKLARPNHQNPEIDR